MNTIQYPSLPVRFGVAFFAITVPLVIIAMTLGNFVQNQFLADFLPPPEDEGFAILFGGVAVMAACLAFIYPSLGIKTGDGWFMSALGVAVPLGVMIFLATHMVQAGYTTLPALGWALEGTYDSVAPMVGVIALAWMTNRRNADA